MQRPTTEVWLVGKGKSLDHFSWIGIPVERIFAINEVGFVIDCEAVFSMDNHTLDVLVGQLPKSKMIITESTKAHYKKLHANLVSFSDAENDVSDTPSFATDILVKHFGVDCIHYVGFDTEQGDTSFAECIKPYVTHPPNPWGYNNTIQNLKSKIKQYGIQVTWNVAPKFGWLEQDQV